MTELRDNIFAIQVPSMAFGFDINNYGDEGELMYMVDVAEITDLPECQHDESLIVKKLGSDSYEILFTTKEVTEEQARPLVKSHYSRSATLNTELGHYQSSGSRTTFMDYENRFCTFKTATESLQSLLRSKGLTAGNYLIIKKTS